MKIRSLLAALVLIFAAACSSGSPTVPAAAELRPSEAPLLNQTPSDSSKTMEGGWAGNGN